ncbi:MAG: GGDEF domain-containing protein [Coriobacteriia bacterium]|nr:GGDEF domain-containing protein [Coriobacteriia bacterium]
MSSDQGTLFLKQYMTGKFLRVYEVDLKKDTLVVVHSIDDENLPDQDGSAFSALIQECVAAGIVHPDDAEEFADRLSVAGLRQWLSTENRPFDLQVRRKRNGVYEWVLIEAMRSENYTEDNQVIYVVLQEQNELLGAFKALSYIYISVHYLDLKNDTYMAVKTNQYIDALIPRAGSNLNEKGRHATMNLVEENHRAETLKFMELETLRGRMNGVDTLTHIFVGNINGWCRARFIAVDYDEQGMLHHVLFTVEGIDAEKRREQRLMHMAQTDLMTGIMNRGTGQRVIQELLEEGVKGLFCMFDVDKFKAVNDTYGHDVGDEVLIAIANSMEKVFRGGDVIMRLGGDEFAFFARGVQSRKVADNIIGRLLKAIEAIRIPVMGSYQIEISLGAVMVGQQSSFEAVYRQADECLYEAKGTEGSNCVFYNQPAK